MASTDKDIVTLTIEAKNLAIDEINETVDGLSELGASSRQAEKDLQKLELTQETINSYKETKAAVTQLRTEFNQAELAYEKMSKAVKENKNATDDEVLAVKTAKRELSDLATVLRTQETEYRKVSKALKAFEVDTKSLDKTQQELQSQIAESTVKSEQLAEQYREQVAAVRQRIDAEKQAIATAKQSEAAEKERQTTLAKTTAEQEKLAESTRKLASAEAAKIANQSKINTALVQYEQGMRELNAEIEDGQLVTSDFIREEERLRKSLELTESQVKTIRNALAAEVVERKKLEKALADQAAQQEKLNNQQAANAASERAAAIEITRVKNAVTEYELALDKLNREKNEGVITNGDYIRSEANLRRSLALTESQVKTTRRAIEADAVTRGEGSKNTDLLTQATRRLAQAYTVLLAAQKAAQAVSAGVTEYGALEAAITKVEKTTGIAREQTEQLAEVLSDLAQDITPTATTELLKYAEVAGQLGTKSTGDLLNLVAAADALNNSTNLAGEEAVEVLARILTMTGQGIPAIQNLSSVVVALGNDFAASEADIVQMTKEIVAGTREINLSAGAAAAIGTTLAELGQPAERSRTAIQRLAGAIKEATINGGEDLERLAMVAGLTGDQIVKTMGKEPEAVLLAFLKGLNNINQAGGQMSAVLQRMGIDGSEALTVLGTLAGGTNRLEVALKTQNQQWVAGNAHMIEAAKAYANQESALGRLGNKFGALTKSIGEAFSDETETAIKKVGDVIVDTTDEIVSLMELLPETVKGLTEAFEVLDNLINTFASDESGLNALDNIFNSVKVSANTVTGAINLMVLGLQGAVVATLELQKIGNEALGLKFDTTGLESYKQLMRETKESIDQDLQDIRNANARMAGESSIAYEGLKDAAVQYEDAIKRLSAEQRASISSIVSKNEYSAQENSLYRELTAAIVRANREIEIESQLKARSAEVAEISNQSKQAEVLNINELINAQTGLNISMTDYLAKSAQVEQSITAVKALRKASRITDEEAKLAIDGLTATLDQYNIEVSKEIQTTEQNTKAVADNAGARRELFKQYQNGVITQQQLVDGMGQLTDYTAQSSNVMRSFASDTNDASFEQAKLTDEILDAQKKIDDYNKQLNAGNIIAADRVRINASLRVEEERLKNLRVQQTTLNELENATYSQLVQMQRQYQKELALVNLEFQRGILTKAQYEAKVRELINTLNELNDVLGKNTDVVGDNNDKTEEETDKLDKKVDKTEEITKWTNLYAEANNYLNQSFDFTSMSVDQLSARYDELNEKLWDNVQVTGQFWGLLADEFDKGFSREQTIIQQTLLYRNLIAEVDNGNLSLQELSKVSYLANNNLTELSGQQLSPLLDAIEKAKREIQELNDIVDEALLDVQDRLDKALGDEQSIVKRKFQKELDEYLALMDKAKLAGDATLVSRIDEAIRKLKQAQDIEYSKQFGTARNQTQNFDNIPTTAQSAAVKPSVSSGSGDSKQMIVFQMQVGNTRYNAQMDESSLNKLVSDINRANKTGV